MLEHRCLRACTSTESVDDQSQGGESQTFRKPCREMRAKSAECRVVPGGIERESDEETKIAEPGAVPDAVEAKVTGRTNAAEYIESNIGRIVEAGEEFAVS